VVWAIDFRFDCTIDGKATKFASMIDERRMDAGPELISRALQRFCGGEVGVSYIPFGSP
jgi:putative transposase